MPTKTKDPKRPRPVRLNEISDRVDAHLKETGVKFSDLVKKSLIAYIDGGGPKDEFPIKEVMEEFKRHRANLSRVGGNLNQLAYRFNTTGIVADDALARTHDQLILEFRDIAQFFRKIEQMILEL